MQPNRKNPAVYCVLSPLYNRSIKDFALLHRRGCSWEIPNLACSKGGPKCCVLPKKPSRLMTFSWCPENVIKREGFFGNTQHLGPPFEHAKFGISQLHPRRCNKAKSLIDLL